MFATGGDRCPVSLFAYYVKQATFWTPLSKSLVSFIWFQKLLLAEVQMNAGTILSIDGTSKVTKKIVEGTSISKT